MKRVRERYYHWIELSLMKHFSSTWDTPNDGYVVPRRVAELTNLEVEFGILSPNSWYIKRTKPYNECSCGEGVGPEYEYMVDCLSSTNRFTLTDEDEALALLSILQKIQDL